MKLDLNSPATKWFIWCCDHFGDFVVGSDTDKDGKVCTRKATYYIEHGTTLCHIFWVTFWAPLIIVTIIFFLFIVITTMHIVSGRDPNLHAALGYAAYAFPELFLLGISVVLGTVILIILGAGRVGMLAYLKALKQRVCPVVTFQHSPMEQLGNERSEVSERER